MHKSRQLSTTVLHGKKSKAAKIPEYQTDPMVRQILLDPNLTDFFRQYTVPGSFADRLFKGEPVPDVVKKKKEKKAAPKAGAKSKAQPGKSGKPKPSAPSR